MMVYICTKFQENTIFIAIISKGHNSIENVGGVTVLVLCISSDSG